MLIAHNQAIWPPRFFCQQNSELHRAPVNPGVFGHHPPPSAPVRCSSALVRDELPPELKRSVPSQKRISDTLLENAQYRGLTGGGGGIRTHERLAPLPIFKTGAFNRSATPPNLINQALTRFWLAARPFECPLIAHFFSISGAVPTLPRMIWLSRPTAPLSIVLNQWL